MLSFLRNPRTTSRRTCSECFLLLVLWYMLMDVWCHTEPCLWLESAETPRP